MLTGPRHRRRNRCRRVVQTGLVGALVACALPSVAWAALAPPEQPGPYKIGFTTFPSTVADGLPTKITVWYPHCRAAAVGCSSPPQGTATYPLTIFTGPNPQVTVPTSLGALENGAVADRPFPFIVDLHGGAANAPFRERSRLGRFQLMEHLASHGFIVAAYERTNAGVCAKELAGPRDVITTMLGRNATAGDIFQGRIDPARIGAMAMSAGGDAGYSLLTGGDPSSSLPQGIDPDARVRGLFVTEAAHSGCGGITPARMQAVTQPYLVMGGSPEAHDINAVQPFTEMTSATPHVLVEAMTKTGNPNLNAEHIGFNAGDCEITDTVREGSLRLQRASGQDPLVEPLTSRFGSDPSILDPGARVLAAEARRLWNNSNFTFIRQKTICNRVGTDPNGILPIGVPSSEGLVTATPPFEPSPFVNVNPPFTACSPVRCITGERMARMVKLFATAFWKAYLDGDRQYNGLLTNGYSNQESDAIITRMGGDGE